MKTLVISDTHLTTVFDQKKYQYLQRITNDADEVIINGDFWDGYLCSFDDFISSRWKELFPLFLRKHTIYVYGNHDKKKWCDERVKRFCIEAKHQHILKKQDREYIIEHGIRMAPSFEIRFPWLFANRFVIILNEIRHYIMYKHMPFFIEVFDRADNEKIKSWCRAHLQDNQYLIVGHTHLQEYDQETRFINTGVNKFGIGQYVVLSGQEVLLKNIRY